MGGGYLASFVLGGKRRSFKQIFCFSFHGACVRVCECVSVHVCVPTCERPCMLFILFLFFGRGGGLSAFYDSLGGWGYPNKNKNKKDNK